MEKNEINKIKEREIWADLFRNPLEYIRPIRYALFAIICTLAIVVIQIACTRGN